MANKEWQNGRPADWQSSLELCGTCAGGYEGHCGICAKDYEAGASAMLKALIRYLWEECRNPAHIPYIRLSASPSYDGDTKQWYFEHRYQCPQCWAELKGETK